MSRNLGIRELTNHMLYLSKKAEIDEREIHLFKFDKIVFVALSYCFQHFLPVNYDIPFEKSNYGAYSSKIASLIKDKNDKSYANHEYINYKKAKKQEYLSETELEKRLIKLLLNEAKKLTKPTYQLINSSEYFKKNIRNFEKEGVFKNERMGEWSLEEILGFAGIQLDNGLPVLFHEYQVLEKYVEVANGKKHIFSINELDILHSISKKRLDIITEKGIKLNKSKQ